MHTGEAWPGPCGAQNGRQLSYASPLCPAAPGCTRCAALRCAAETTGEGSKDRNTSPQHEPTLVPFPTQVWEGPGPPSPLGLHAATRSWLHPLSLDKPGLVTVRCSGSMCRWPDGHSTWGFPQHLPGSLSQLPTEMPAQLAACGPRAAHYWPFREAAQSSHLPCPAPNP